MAIQNDSHTPDGGTSMLVTQTGAVGHVNPIGVNLSHANPRLQRIVNVYASVNNMLGLSEQSSW